MATFLFWNMGKKALAEPLFRLAMRHEVDVLMLAECARSKIIENTKRQAYYIQQLSQMSPKTR